MEDKELIKLSMQRWRVIKEIEKQEIRVETIEMRWKKLNTILQMVHDLGISPQEDKEIAIVRERWIRLKKSYP